MSRRAERKREVTLALVRRFFDGHAAAIEAGMSPTTIHTLMSYASGVALKNPIQHPRAGRMEVESFIGWDWETA